MGDNIMITRIKAIRNDADYQEALALLEALILENPSAGTDEASQIDVLSDLIEHYESTNFPIDIPNAIEAIKFRMKQLDLKPTDLTPYIGSASRVSEILSGKRNLTVDMINALSLGLGIPEKALLKKSSSNDEYSRYIPQPVYRQMLTRGYFKNTDSDDKSNLIKKFFESRALQPAMLFRKTQSRTDDNNNPYIDVAWANKVIDNATKIKLNTDYRHGVVDLDYMRNIAKYSIDEESGAKKAINHLSQDGIVVVIEPQLDGSKLDGSTIFEDREHPIIGLTLRYDRLDNFWFTLMHELAHVSLHYTGSNTCILDNLDSKKELSDIEKEADDLASEALVDSRKWAVSPARIVPSPLAAGSLADELGVHIAIIAGKARFEGGNWKYLSNIVGKYKIREQFKDIKW